MMMMITVYIHINLMSCLIGSSMDIVHLLERLVNLVSDRLCITYPPHHVYSLYR